MFPGLQRRWMLDATVESKSQVLPTFRERGSHKGPRHQWRKGKGKVGRAPQGLFLTPRGLHITLGELLLGPAHSQHLTWLGAP